jgi:hypothetical protein
MNLSAIQIENLLISLLSILKTRITMGLSATISATRCLINVLNQHPDRMAIFSSSTIDGVVTLVDVIQKSFPYSQSLELCTKEVEEKVTVTESDVKDSAGDFKNIESESKFSTRNGVPSKSLDTCEEDKSHLVGTAESKDEFPPPSFHEHNDYCMQEIQYCVKIIYMMVCQR